MNKLTPKHQHRQWLEHSLALFSFTLLTILVTWPTAKDINQLIIGNGADPRHILSNFWNVKEWVIGQKTLFDLPLLYYPLGASMLTNATGPLTGLFGLPFWSFGPEVVYNATYMIGYILTGLSMYTFARAEGLHYQTAIFSAIVLMLAPICVGGFLGHIDKVFLGCLPLLLLTLHKTYRLECTLWWVVIPGFIFLLLLLTNGTQFSVAALTTILYSLITIVLAPPPTRVALLKRGLIAAVSTVLFTVPILYLLLQAAHDPLVKVEINTASQYYQPDLVQFFIPSPNSLIFAEMVKTFTADYEGIIQGIETLIALSWTGIILCGVAFVYNTKQVRHHLILLVCLMILSLGPYLKILGNSQFTQYELPIILPYAFLTSLPGFDFMRTPGRFMFAGYIFFSLVAGYGLAYLTARWPKRHNVIIIVVTTLIFIEYWPHPLPQEKLPPTPDFYHHLADDTKLYGVFDLPIRNERDPYIPFSANYQIYQMTHRKGIASGYISRTYSRHPFLPDLMQVGTTPTDLLINGEPIPISTTLLYELNRHNYRYVVLHKPLLDQSNEEQTLTLIDNTFATPPIVDDKLSTVYKVEPISDTLMIRYDSLNWREPESVIRWAVSPAKLRIDSPISQSAHIEILPVHFHNPHAPKIDSDLQGVSQLELQTNDGSITADFISGKTTLLPLNLITGLQTITLMVTPGSNRPEPYTGNPDRLLHFSIRSINLITEDYLEKYEHRLNGEALTVNFDNQIDLLGYELFQTLTGFKIMLYWQATTPFPTAYKAFIHVTTPDSTLITQVDSPPVGNKLPTTQWLLKEPVSGEHQFSIDNFNTDTLYQVRVGLYDPETLKRLPILDKKGKVIDNQIILTTINDNQQ